jgi:hypothetical protein
MTDAPTGRIRIVRPPVRSPDQDRPYAIVLDGEVAGEVEHGADCLLEVAPGRHLVELKLDDAGSPVREVTVAAGEDVVLGCRGRAAGVNVLFGMFGRGRLISWV